MRARARLFVCALASALLVLATPVLLWAHASLVSSDPAAKSLLRVAPSRIRLVFSEALEPTLGRISLVGPGGVIKLAAAGDPHDVNALIAPVGAIASGAYRVEWRVVSADGHPVEGNYIFTLELPSGAAPAPSPPSPTTHDVGHDEASPSWGPTIAGAPVVASVLRGLALGTLMAAAGLLVFLSFTRGDAGDLRRPEKFARWLSIAAVLLLVLHHTAWAVNAVPEHRMDADMLSAMLSSGVGRAEIWRTGFALMAVWGIALVRRPRLAMPFSIAALLASGVTGHSAAIQPLWTTPAKAAHLVAGAVWLGGLIWLLTLDRNDEPRFQRQAARVSSAALTAVLVVLASGIVQTFLFLPTPVDLFRSAYGAITLAKIAGLLVLVGYGAYHKLRVLPALASDPTRSATFARSLRQEVIVMTVVVMLGGLLGYVSPPTDARLSSSHALAR